MARVSVVTPDSDCEWEEGVGCPFLDLVDKLWFWVFLKAKIAYMYTYGHISDKSDILPNAVYTLMIQIGITQVEKKTLVQEE